MTRGRGRWDRLFVGRLGEVGRVLALIVSTPQIFSLPGHSELLRRVELDMDYYRDKLGHALLEVLPNTLSFGQRKTDPRQVHVMRWMAGKRAGDEFAPRYTMDR